MRFFSNGPNIPDELLEERDNGNVVFFCGAGVSQPIFPGFLGLAEKVIHKLGGPSDSKARALLDRVKQDPNFGPTLDQVFSVLQHEYGAGTIDDEVSQQLKTPTDTKSESHSLILRLSRNAGGQPQVVTTNFDLLFEKVKSSIRRHVPPALPDLASGQPIEGLVYLHGRRSAQRTGGAVRQGLVLSSADFGRAYLADGWATRFVRELLQNYVIVLVGYSATDPPIRYLLEGLHSRSDGTPARIYAFDRGTKDEVEERWRDRGVLPLAYPRTDKGHGTLWASLRAWADRADNLDNWQQSVIDLAKQGPRNLEAFQRGQVAALARTTAGAKLFAESDPVLPAEWLCVLDARVRYGKPDRKIGQNNEFDPLIAYGLDDDPPRPPETGPTSAFIGDDLLSPNSTDEKSDSSRQLAGVRGWSPNPLSPRLFYLARWIGKVAIEPTTVWWASGCFALHSELLDQIALQLRTFVESTHKATIHSWLLLLEGFRNSAEIDHDRSWHDFTDKLQQIGWVPGVIREFELVTQPDVVFSRPLRMKSTPPNGSWSDLAIHSIVQFEVRFPVHDLEKLEISSEALPEVFRILRRGLERGCHLLRDIDTQYWHTATFHAEDLPGSRHLSDAERYFHFVAALLDRLEVECPDIARRELGRWPENDGFFFDKLKIYAWMKSSLFTGQEVASGLLGLSEDGFWKSLHRRELLHTLLARWTDFSAEERYHIEQRIVGGPGRWDGEEETEFKKRKSITSAKILGWLVWKGCELSRASLTELPRLRSADECWSPSWDEDADRSYDGRGGWVSTESEPTKIQDAPISQLIKLAEEYTSRPPGEFKEYLPFQGLVEQHPFKALAALSYEVRQGRFPVEFWRTALSHWPEHSGERLRCLFACRISKLPTDVLIELRFYAPDWLAKNLPSIAHQSLQDAIKVWDRVVNALLEGGEAATQSSLGETSVGGTPLHLSRRTYNHSISSPIGRMAAGVLDIISTLQLKKDQGIPEEFHSRLQRLLDTPGEGADHAVSQYALRLNWLYFIDSRWVRAQLLPLFEIDNERAEPAWSGFLHSNRLPAADLFGLVKADFLNLVECASRWHWRGGSARRLHESLVIACYLNLKDERFVAYEEARCALQKSDDEGRAHSLWVLTSIVKDKRAWESFGKPFIQHAWPRERHFQTVSTSRQFAMMAEEAGNHFADVVKTILSLLIPVPHLHSLIRRTTKAGEREGAPLPSKFPKPMLALLDRLVPNDFHTAPRDLKSLLDMIADAKPALRQDQRWRRLYEIATRA